MAGPNFYVRFPSGGGGGGGGGGNIPSTILTDSQTIANGSATVSVTFGAIFSALPIVVTTLCNTTDANPIQFSIVETAIADTGFTVTLSAPVPTANYFINWMAASVND